MVPQTLLISNVLQGGAGQEGSPGTPDDVSAEGAEAALNAPSGILADAAVRAREAMHIETGAFEGWLRSLLGSDQPWLFDEDYILLATWQWLGLLAILLVSVMVERIFVLLIFRSLRKMAGRERVKVDEDNFRGLGRPLRLLLLAFFFAAFLPIIGLTADQAALDNFFIKGTDGLMALASVWGAWCLVDIVCVVLRARADKSASKFDDMLVPLVRRVLKIVVVLLGVVYIAALVSDDVWAIVAGMSVGMVAIGLASKDSVENLIGTFTILMDKPFQLGDCITVDGVEGTVEEFGIRSTRVRTFYNSLISVPNRRFVNSNIDNWGARSYRRIRTVLSLTYQTPPEKVEAFCEGVREIIRVHPYTRKDYFHVYLMNLGDSGLEVLVYAFVSVPDWATELRERHRLLADILRLAERLGIQFAYPTSTLHVVRPGEKEEHPDRPKVDPEGATIGRKTARSLVAHSQGHLSGAVPPPVDFSIQFEGDPQADDS